MLTLTIDGVDFTSTWRLYDSEWTQRAYMGETIQSRFVIDDPDGTIDHLDLAARKIVEVWEDASGSPVCMYRGRVANKTLGRYSSGRQGAAMRWTVTAEDYNVDFRGLRVDESTRNEETDYARVLGYAAGYLAGSSSTNENARDTTDLGTSYVLNSDTITMEAETYTDIYVNDVLQRICEQSAKTYFAFVDDAGDGQLYYALHADTTFASDISITDDSVAGGADEIDVFTAYFTEQAGTHDGQHLISGGSMRYGSNQFYEYSDPTSEGFHDKWEEHFTDENITTVFTADRVLKAIINSRNNEDFTFHASIDMRAADAHRIRAGMSVPVRLVAADLPTETNQRAVQVTHQPMHPDEDGEAWYRVTLELGVPRGRPFQRGPRTKPGPFPPQGPTAASCLLDVSDMTQIATPNGNFETGLATNWTPGAIGAHGVQGPATGDWEGSYYYEINGASSMIYEGLTGYSFVSGTTYVFRIRTASANATTFLRITDAGASANYADVSVGGGSEWQDNCLEWTPGSTTSGVRIALASDSGLDNFSLDDLRVYLGGTGDTTEPVGETGSGTPGTSTGTYAPIDHVHEHPHLTDASDYHDADQIAIDDAGGYYTGTDVEAALQEIGSGGFGGSIAVAEADGTPDVSPVTRIEFDGPTVTDDGSGQVTVAAAAPTHSHGSPAAGFHGVLVQRTTDFVAADSNDSNPDFDTEVYDTDGAWTVGSPKIFTVPASWDGLMVQIGAWVGFETGATGMVETKIYRNVTPGSISTTNDDKLVPGGVAQHYPASDYNTFLAHVTAPFQVATGDTLTIALKSAAGHDALAYESTSILFGMWIVEPGEGAQGDPGQGVPTGGTAGQVLTKDSGTDYDTSWQDAASGDPADDTAAWMPLTTVVGGVPELVWDGDDSLIPTLTPM